MKAFSFEQRRLYWKDLDQQDFDLLIVGGGINGAGVARDASSRGMKVVVVEAEDFASGSSSRSSKLIHGGIRYLENMEFKLVFEALNERTKLFRLAPHLVHPLRFMIPLYRDSRVGMFKMGLGMWLYDALSLFQAPELHERLSSQESMHRMPLLQKDQLVGSYVYSDAYMDDDRLVHETLRSAHEMGAIALNYVKAKTAQFSDDGRIQSVTVQDKFSGQEKKIRARHVVGSAGPWTDLLGQDLFPHWKKVLRPTKGVHITVAKERLPLSSAVVMGAEKSDRIIFGIPRYEMVIIGTTDTDYNQDPSDVSVLPEDVKYLLGVVEHYFPGAKLKAEDILASYAGVRPLVDDGAENEGKTSREHKIWTLEDRHMTFVAGGKYTTYRLMAKDVVEKVLHYFPLEDRVRFGRSQTESALLPEVSTDLYNQAIASVSNLAKLFSRPAPEVLTLCERYGMEAEAILSRNPANSSYWQLEAAQAVDYTMCLNLVDFYSRRVHLFLARQDHGWPVFEEVAEVFAEKLGWDAPEIARQKKNLEAYMKRELSWQADFRPGM
jgi:glycerol-3-phosphate dehydrogenase